MVAAKAVVCIRLKLQPYQANRPENTWLAESESGEALVQRRKLRQRMKMK
jgi:hypothetical protein